MSEVSSYYCGKCRKLTPKANMNSRKGVYYCVPCAAEVK